MGTSICHLVLGDRPALVEGMCGVVEDGILPGLFGFEAGQSAVGDIFAWFVDDAVPPAYHEAAARRASTSTRPRAGGGEAAPGRERAARPRLVERQPLDPGRRRPERAAGRRDAGDPAPEIYRALIEATAFGTRMIVDAFEEAGVAVQRDGRVRRAAERNRLLMQVYADVTDREFKVAASAQTPGARVGDVRGGRGRRGAGGYDSIEDASSQMARLGESGIVPNPANRAVYDELYAEYLRLHDLFGRGGDDAMKRLRAVQRAVIESDAFG